MLLLKILDASVPLQCLFDVSHYILRTNLGLELLLPCLALEQRLQGDLRGLRLCLEQVPVNGPLDFQLGNVVEESVVKLP